MPVVSGFVGDTPVKVLRDTGCSCIIVRENLVAEDQKLQEWTTLILADGTVRIIPLAKVSVDTPYLTGEMKALCVKTPVYDLIIGNIDGARNADYLDPEWRPEICSVTTRSQAKKSHQTIPLKVADNTEAAVVNKERLVELQRGHDKQKSAESVRLADDERLDDENLFDLNELQHKENVKDIQFGQNLTQTQHEELRVLTQELEHRFTPDPGTTDTNQPEVNLTSDNPVRDESCRMFRYTSKGPRKNVRETPDLRVDRDARLPVVIAKEQERSNLVCMNCDTFPEPTVFDPGPVTFDL